VTSTSWSKWVTRLEARGHRVLAPAWPHDDRPVAALRAAPDPGLAHVGIAEIVERYASVVRSLPEPPILIGHSFGGLFVQMLLDRGLGAAGVAIDPAPPKGVLPGVSAIRASLPVLMGWGSWREIRTMSFESFSWGWVHTLPPAEQRAAYDEYVVPTPGRIFLQALLAPATDDTRVNFQNRQRPPLLIIAGELDRTVEPSMNRANFTKQKRSGAVTELREFAGRTHWICMQPGWEEVADFAIAWAERARDATTRT
jgi:pimeloyl-ACP methyl ester carboxylesterase